MVQVCGRCNSVGVCSGHALMVETMAEILLESESALSEAREREVEWRVEACRLALLHEDPSSVHRLRYAHALEDLVSECRACVSVTYHPLVSEC